MPGTSITGRTYTASLPVLALLCPLPGFEVAAPLGDAIRKKPGRAANIRFVFGKLWTSAAPTLMVKTRKASERSVP